MNGQNGYFKIRKCGSDVHTFELSKSKNGLIFTTGKTGLETLSTIYKQYDAIAAINGGFFNLDGSCESLFKWSEKTTTVVLTKDNKLLLLDAESITADKEKEIETNAKWVCGGGYTLIENGKISIRHADYSGDYAHRNPRTMLGQTADGSLILVVVQGRALFNKGMNAAEQAKTMFELGCITAVNFDGGGSSEMIVDGKVMNKPTDGKERKIGSVFIVVPKEVKKKYEIIDPKLNFGTLSYINKPENIIIHHALAKTCTIQDIHKWHIENGWVGCGYHYFVNKKGEIYKGRPDTAIGSHCKEESMNFHSLGICLEGCYEDYGTQTDKLVPIEQMNALKWLIVSLKVQYNIKNVYPHRKFATYKKCPGDYFPWDEFIKQI